MKKPTKALGRKKRSLINPAVRASQTLVLYDIPVEMLIDSEENPNEMDDTTFDELVEGVKKEGIDEPPIVMPVYSDGKSSVPDAYIITSGHHRVKAAKANGHTTVPCVIKNGWDEDARKIALVRRNVLRGNLNPEKFTALFNELTKKHDRAVLQLQMGFSKKDAFEKVYKDVAKSLPPKQRAALAEAKENIRSVDDLSSVLNTIFKEHGSELDSGFMVFSFGGKNHHYVKIDAETDAALKKVEKDVTKSGLSMSEVIKKAISDISLPQKKGSGKVRIRLSRPK